MKSEVGQRIRSLRQEFGFTQTELAGKISVTFQAVSKWEKGKAAPDISTLPLLSDLFGVSIDYLVRGREFSGQSNRKHWAVSYLNGLIKPVRLSLGEESRLLKIIQFYKKDLVKECLQIAFEEFAQEDHPGEHRFTISMIFIRLQSTLRERALAPAQRKTNEIIAEYCTKTGFNNRYVKTSLKSTINVILTYKRENNASEKDLLDTLDLIKNNYLQATDNPWECKNKMLAYLHEEKDTLDKKQSLLFTQKISEAIEKYAGNALIECNYGWPIKVDECLQEARKMVNEDNVEGYINAIYSAISEALKNVVDALPTNRQHGAKGKDLIEYCDNLGKWFGFYIGKPAVSQIEVFLSLYKGEADLSSSKAYGLLFSFNNIMTDLYRKYVNLMDKKYGELK